MVRHGFTRSSRLAVTIGLGIASLHTPRSRAIAQQQSGVDRRASVLLLDFNVSALKDAADWAPIGRGIPNILMTELSANPDIRIVDRAQIQTALDELNLTRSALVDPSTAARVGKIVGARYIVSGSIMIDPSKNVRLDAHGIKLETMVQEYTQKLSGKSDNVLELIAQMGQEMSKKFDPTPFDAPARNSGDGGRPTKEGLRLAMLLGSAVDLQDRHNIDGAKALVRQALALAPENASAKAMLVALDRAK